MRIKLSNGKKVKVLFEHLYGLYEPAYKELTIDPTRNRDELDTAIHEMLHAERPEMREKTVTKTASSIARLLWKMGYRR